MQIDHVEIFVPNRYEAANWYQQILGLEILKEHEDWANEGGPLMISSDCGKTMIALFEGHRRHAPDVDGDGLRIGLRRIAFRVDSDGFREFLERLETMALYSDPQQTRRVSGADVVDHDKAWSIYFCDPYGNKLEVTTYDYEATTKSLSTTTVSPTP